MSAGTSRQADAGPFLLCLLPPLQEFRILTQRTPWNATRAKWDALHVRQWGNSDENVYGSTSLFNFLFIFYITGKTDMTLKLKKTFWSTQFPGGCSTCINILKILSPTRRNFLTLVSLVCNNFPHLLLAVSVNCCEQNSWKAGGVLVWKVCGVAFGCLLMWWFSSFYSRPKRSPDTELWINEVWLNFAIFMCTHKNACTYVLTRVRSNIIL